MTDTLVADHDTATARPPRGRPRGAVAVAVAVIVALAVIAAIGFALSRRNDQTASTKTTLPSQPVAVRSR